MTLDRSLEQLESDDGAESGSATDSSTTSRSPAASELAHHGLAVSEWERRRYLELT